MASVPAVPATLRQHLGVIGGETQSPNAVSVMGTRAGADATGALAIAGSVVSVCSDRGVAWMRLWAAA